MRAGCCVAVCRCAAWWSVARVAPNPFVGPGAGALERVRDASGVAGGASSPAARRRDPALVGEVAPASFGSVPLGRALGAVAGWLWSLVCAFEPLERAPDSLLEASRALEAVGAALAPASAAVRAVEAVGVALGVASVAVQITSDLGASGARTERQVLQGSRELLQDLVVDGSGDEDVGEHDAGRWRRRERRSLGGGDHRSRTPLGGLLAVAMGARRAPRGSAR